MLGMNLPSHVFEDSRKVLKVNAALHSAAEIWVARQGVRDAVDLSFDVLDGERETL